MKLLDDDGRGVCIMNELDKLNKALKKCPFCGGRAVIQVSEYREEPYYIECLSMCCRTDIYKDVHTAIKVWNKRYRRGSKE